MFKLQAAVRSDRRKTKIHDKAPCIHSLFALLYTIYRGIARAFIENSKIAAPGFSPQRRLCLLFCSIGTDCKGGVVLSLFKSRDHGMIGIALIHAHRDPLPLFLSEHRFPKRRFLADIAA